jgi:hypothetical protein
MDKVGEDGGDVKLSSCSARPTTAAHSTLGFSLKLAK